LTRAVGKEKVPLILLELRNAKNTIELTGGTLPEDLKPRILAIDPKFESIWSGFERNVHEDLKALIASKKFPELSPEEYSSVASRAILSRAIGFLELLDKITGVGVGERDEGDRLLRYETSNERNLGRALDRLDRLQLRRKGETVQRYARLIKDPYHYAGTGRRSVGRESAASREVQLSLIETVKAVHPKFNRGGHV
jgi:hypothetical protein